jgi:Divergent InlB B-repeat domain
MNLLLCTFIRPARLLAGVAVAAFLCLAAGVINGQNSQFTYDASGGLVSQTSESVGVPNIIGQPQMQIVIPGQTAAFSVMVADARGVSYQWLFNSSAIADATSDSLLLANVSATNEGSYSVVLANSSGSVTSSVVQLYIDSRGVGMPDSWQLAYFGNLTQNPLGDYDGDGVSNLQEFLDGTNPTNAASALYRITLLNDGGTVVVVPNQMTYTNGQVVTLTATGSDALPFHAWTGDIVSRSNPLTVTMTNNLNLFAHFQPFLLHWTNSAGGDWNVAANWLPNLVPGSNENVEIGASATLLNGVVVTENSNVDLLDLTLGRPNVGFELSGSGRVTIAGSGLWIAGTMSGSGATVVLPGASLSISNVATVFLNNRTLENAGAVSWSGGTMAMNGGIITNDAGAQFELLNSASFSYGGGTP